MVSEKSTKKGSKKNKNKILPYWFLILCWGCWKDRHACKEEGFHNEIKSPQGKDYKADTLKAPSFLSNGLRCMLKRETHGSNCQCVHFSRSFVFFITFLRNEREETRGWIEIASTRWEISININKNNRKKAIFLPISTHKTVYTQFLMPLRYVLPHIFLLSIPSSSCKSPISKCEQKQVKPSIYHSCVN